MENLSFDELHHICSQHCAPILHTPVKEQIAQIRDSYSESQNFIWTFLLCTLFFVLGIFFGHAINFCSSQWNRLIRSQQQQQEPPTA